MDSIGKEILAQAFGENASYDIVQRHKDIEGTDKSGRHSDVNRVTLHTDGGTKQVIVKLVDGQHMPDRAPFRWHRDLKSYLNDILFYQHCAPFCTKNGVGIAKTYLAYEKHDEALQDAKQCQFALVMNDISSDGSHQTQLYDTEGAKPIMNWLAKFHATFWGLEGEAGEACKKLVWKDFGTVWNIGKRDPGEMDKMPESWKKVTDAWAVVNPDFINRQDILALGSRFQKVANILEAELVQRRHNANTLLHGDIKSANIFTNTAGEVTVVDWQWTGPGNPVVDLVYFLYGACTLDTTKKHETELVELYHNCLLKALKEQGKETDWTLSQLKSDYEVAFLDYGRYTCAYTWPARPITPERCKLLANSMTTLAHNKIEDAVYYFMDLASNKLKQYE